MSYRISYRGSDGVRRTTRPMLSRRTADEFIASYRKLMGLKALQPIYELERRDRGVWVRCCG